MFERRRPAKLVTPIEEDQGIFKGEVIQLTAELMPLFGRNMRDDVIIKGFVVGGDAIDVIFPGRRKSQAIALQKRIQAEWSKVCTEARHRGVSPVIEEFRYPIQVEGAWRTRFNRDTNGWETRNHQLYAARWMVADKSGNKTTYGEPVIRAS